MRGPVYVFESTLLINVFSCSYLCWRGLFIMIVALLMVVMTLL